MRMDIDEVCNGDLATMTAQDVFFLGWDMSDIQGEIGRVDVVISKNVMTGIDLTYWHQRRAVLKKKVRELEGQI